MFRRTKLGGIKFNKLVVRLKRFGCRGYPLYEVVVMKQKSRRNGIIIERLGFVNPKGSSVCVFVIDSQRLAYLLNHGVIVHSSVKGYISKFLMH